MTVTLSGGELTIDHYRPQARGGSDYVDNLVYCCFRCNSFKKDYWSAGPEFPSLWNPRSEPWASHFCELPDGRLEPLTPTGHCTVERLHLNRTALIAHRLVRRKLKGQERGSELLGDVLEELRRLQMDYAALAEQFGELQREQLELLRRQSEQED